MHFHLRAFRRSTNCRASPLKGADSPPYFQNILALMARRRVEPHHDDTYTFGTLKVRSHCTSFMVMKKDETGHLHTLKQLEAHWNNHETEIWNTMKQRETEQWNTLKQHETEQWNTLKHHETEQWNTLKHHETLWNRAVTLYKINSGVQIVEIQVSCNNIK